MGVKKKVQKAAATATGVVIATTGLSNCDNGGAVDPLPPALQCNLVGDGQTLVPTAEQSGDTVTVRIANETLANVEWNGVQITDLVGATVVELAVPGAHSRDPIVVALKLETPSTISGSFRLQGELQELTNGTSCAVDRTFTFDITADGVDIALRLGDPLPLAARHAAQIVLLGRSKGAVDLEARTPYDGTYTVLWSVTHGAIDVEAGTRAQWRLPEDPGIYQVQLVVDYGADGLGFDEMMLEVG